MKNLVFYGDGLLCPPDGYGENVVDLLVSQNPGAAVQSFHRGETTLTLEAALKGAALHVLGKAPDWVYLGLGTPDFLQSRNPERTRETLDSLLQLILLKTKAKIAFTSVCEAFLPEENQRESARIYNASLPALVNERVLLIDLNSNVHSFLEKHRQGSGEKRALHVLPLQLTSMGRIFLSHVALKNLPWDNL